MTELVISEFHAPWQPNTNNWDFSQVKNYYEVILGKMLQNTPAGQDDIEVPYFKAQHVQWNNVVIDELPTMWASPSETEMLRVKKGDLLVCEGGEAGRAGIVRNEPPANTIIQNAIHLVRPKRNGDIKYLRYLLQHAASHGWLDVICNRATIAHFTVEKFNQLWAWFPPLSEQHAIADYLDRETARIDTLITTKERLLELLAEKRQAIITHTITLGLNPNAPLRNSGVEEIEKIPSHWEVKKLKYVTHQITVGIVITPSKYYVDSGVPCPRSLNVKNGKLTEDDLVYISPESNQELYKSMIFKGDLVSVRSGQPGATAIVDERFDGANCIDLIITRKSHRFDSEFMVYLLNSEVIQRQFALGSGGAIQQHFNIETAKELLVLLPPMDEQKKIVVFLEETTKRIDRLAELANKTIERLQERRASLIAAAVSGQIRVV